MTGCLEACRRCDAVVDAVVDRSPSGFEAIGPHLRHCIEHFRLLLDGWRVGLVDYDARPREGALEHDPLAARAALAEIADDLAGIDRADLGRAFVVRQLPAPACSPVSSPTRLDRELLFLSGHTIHHIAIMLLAARAAGIELPAALGVAYSTEAHHESLVSNV